jgi:glycosyltransferase involved in cell wall biosynthesis
MPCYNHARFLPDAIESVLAQTHRDLELIITDDCSTDTSWEVMSRYAAQDRRVRLVRHTRNGGLPKSRNDAIAESSGEFITFCDSDDVWEPRKLATQLELLSGHGDYNVTYCDTVIIDERGRSTGQRFSELYPLPRQPSGWLFDELVRRNFINVQSAMIRRSCLQTVPRFDEDLGVLEDWWFWVQLSPHHRFLYTSERLARYRVHSASSAVALSRRYPVNRVRIFRRLLARYAVSSAARAEIAFKMGVDLCVVRKESWGRRLLWRSLATSLRDPRALPTFARAARRLLTS